MNDFSNDQIQCASMMVNCLDDLQELLELDKVDESKLFLMRQEPMLRWLVTMDRNPGQYQKDFMADRQQTASYSVDKVTGLGEASITID